MTKGTYPITKMRSDLRHDFKRYLEFNNEQEPVPLKKCIHIITMSKGLWVIVIYRFGRWINSSFKRTYFKPLKHALKTLYFFGRYLSICFVKTEISIAAEIGEGLFISNKGNIMLGVEKMGKNCTVHHNVTFGQDRNRREPVVGDYVWIGSDSIIYGGVNIGSHTVIQEKSVLSKSIQNNKLVGGNPCRIIKKNIKNGPFPIKGLCNIERGRHGCPFNDC